MEIAIRAGGLSKQFRAVSAVTDLTMDVPAGAIFGFLGPNGAGKTTTIHLLLGLLKPTAGWAEVLGADPQKHGDWVRGRTGALLEHHGLYERMSASANLEFFARIYRLPLLERGPRIREVLERMGLWDRRGENVGTWSRGMKQKLAIARTFLHQPPLIFLDEPTAGHDPKAAREVRDLLVQLARTEGVTFFLTTHNLSEAERICSRVGVIQKGRLIAQGAPDALRAKAGRPRIEIRGTGFGPALLKALARRRDVATSHAEDGLLTIELTQVVPASPLVRLVVESGARVEEVRKGSPTLEDAFLELVSEEAE